VFRFAPSPNGPLHLGHALSALTGFEMARERGGRFLLRIEDIDFHRTREEHVVAIERDLTWLGIVWDGPVLRQSTRAEAYRAATERLLDEGLLYRCHATRSEIADVAALDGASNGRPCDPDGVALFPRTLRRIAERDGVRRDDVPFALRLDMERAVVAAHRRLDGKPVTFNEMNADGLIDTRVARPERWGDAIIVRKDIPTSYHLAVVVDDAYQGVTHVTRGQDILAATDLHRLLQVLLGLPEPLYHHHRLVLGVDGKKLAKSAGDRGFAGLAAVGWSSVDVRRLADVRLPPLFSDGNSSSAMDR
jgi:glutamyl-Q tRNA(Asp) synthetase